MLLLPFVEIPVEAIAAKFSSKYHGGKGRPGGGGGVLEVVYQNLGWLLFGVRFVYLPDSILPPSPKPENRLANLWIQVCS